MVVDQRFGESIVQRGLQILGLCLILSFLLFSSLPAQCTQYTKWGENADSLSTKAKALREKGGAHLLEAINVLKCAIELARTEKPRNDRFFADNYYRLGFYYDQVGFNQEALTAYHQGLSELEARMPLEGKEMQRLPRVFSAIAVKYSHLAQSDKAKTYISKAVESAVVYYGENDTNTQIIMANEISMLTNLGEFWAADSLARRALAINHHFRRPVPNAAAHVLINLSDNFLKQGMVDSGMHYIQQALPFLPKTKSNVQFAIKQTYADCLILQGNFEEGLRLFEEVIAEADSSTQMSQREVAILYVRYAEALRNAGKIQEALSYLQRAIIKFIPRFTSSSPETNPESNLWNGEPWLFEVFRHKAACFEGLGDTDEALDCYVLAFDYLDNLRKSFTTSEARSGISNFAFPAYERAIRLALHTYRSTRGNKSYLELAFRFIEQSKTNEVLESLQEIEQGAFLNLDQSLLDKWRFQKAEIARLNESPSAHEAELIRLYKSQDSLRTLLEEKFPLFSELIRPPITPDAVRAKLGLQEMFLEYFMGDSTLYIFAIDKSHYDCFEVPLTAYFYKSMAQMIWTLSRAPGRAEKTWERFGPYSAYLFSQLIGPVIRGQFSAGVPGLLTVVPDGRLALLPFECLLTNGATSTFVEAPYLCRFTHVRYGQSATTLLAQGNRKVERNFQGVLALAPATDSLDPLKSAPEEVTKAAEAIENSKVLEGEEANQQQLFALAPAYRILHLACHAFADTVSHMHSWFALQGPNRGIDSLFSHEIFGQDLNAELVVLSACGTGRGKVQTGEGVMSLARSFQVAGCPTAVMSLWNLDDGPTANIMGYFYSHIAAGKSASESLRDAKLAFLGSEEVANNPRKAHPYYWAGLVTVGEDGPNLPQHDVNYRRWIIWGCILAVIIALWQRRRRRRRAARRRR